MSLRRHRRGAYESEGSRTGSWSYALGTPCTWTHPSQNSHVQPQFLSNQTACGSFGRALATAAGRTGD
eukprot:809514-Rhodomonas_salina.3